jgi:hypothetical protein
MGLFVGLVLGMLLILGAGFARLFWLGAQDCRFVAFRYPGRWAAA